MLFGRTKKANEKTAPTEVVDITPSVRVAIWNAGRIPGREHPVHVSFERIAADGKSRKTLLPETLLELPQAIGVLASALSKSALPDGLRQSLSVLSDRMFRVAQETGTQAETTPLTNGESIFG